jgi:hypothetical protein
MAEEYHILSGKQPNGQLVRMLISNEEIKGVDIQDFFVPRSTEVKELGIVQIIGDVKYLDDIYTSDFI